MAEEFDDSGGAFFRGALIALVLSIILVGVPILAFFWGRASANCVSQSASSLPSLGTSLDAYRMR